ncbi:acyltransferase family protein [Spongiimicrobium sp. 2-473A-2-J]|uniref:acyltransferase family protein n=1 Tax=Eudoraea algarum TaxID=3417568 RepID=UPI003D35C935
MKRNITLDFTKLILSFLVVIIHNPIFTDFRFFSNLITNGLARIAVPCFFVLNGLYIGKVLSNRASFRKYLKKVFTFYVVWMLIYAPFYLFHYTEDLTKSILTNVSSILFGFWHLWYIVGLIGGASCLYYLKTKGVGDKKLLRIAIFLFGIGWGIQQLELFYPNEEGLLGSIIRSSYPSRNFLFMGLPFIAIGYLISKESFVARIKQKLISIPFLLFLFTLLFSETILHYFLIGRRGFDFYISLILLCPILIMFLEKKSKTVEVKDDFISKLSAAIYFIHPLTLFLIKNTFPDFESTGSYILILFFSMILGTALVYANKRLKIFF